MSTYSLHPCENHDYGEDRNDDEETPSADSLQQNIVSLKCLEWRVIACVAPVLLLLNRYVNILYV